MFQMQNTVFDKLLLLLWQFLGFVCLQFLFVSAVPDIGIAVVDKLAIGLCEAVSAFLPSRTILVYFGFCLCLISICDLLEFYFSHN